MNKYHLRLLGNTIALTPLLQCIESNATTCVNINYGTDFMKCLLSHYNPPFVSPNLEGFICLYYYQTKDF